MDTIDTTLLETHLEETEIDLEDETSIDEQNVSVVEYVSDSDQNISFDTIYPEQEDSHITHPQHSDIPVVSIQEPEVQPSPQEPEVQPVVEEPEVQPSPQEPEVQPVVEEPEVQSVVEESVEVQPVVEESVVEEPEVQPEVQPEVNKPTTVPTVIFIIPYRDREVEMKEFKTEMAKVLHNIPTHQYEIYFVHQCDTRAFNRGAIRNIGFMAMRDKYPNDYKRITFVFNDVDNYPINGHTLYYPTRKGTVKHFYGFEHVLGGIVSFNGEDFEKINGYPNFWAWGFEDNMLLDRAKRAGLNIDRTEFVKFIGYNKNDKNVKIHHKNDGLLRHINIDEYTRFKKNTQEGINSITDVKYSYNNDTNMIDVSNFMTGIEENVSKRELHDLRFGNYPYIKYNQNPKSQSMKMKMVLS